MADAGVLIVRSPWWWRAGLLLVVVGIGTAVVVADDGLRSEVHATLSNLARALS